MNAIKRKYKHVRYGEYVPQGEYTVTEPTIVILDPSVVGYDVPTGYAAYTESILGDITYDDTKKWIDDKILDIQRQGGRIVDTLVHEMEDGKREGIIIYIAREKEYTTHRDATKNGNKTIAYIFGGVVVFGCIGGLVYYFSKKKK